MGQLYRKLLEYGQSDYYPYHMPGHKRNPLTEVLGRVGDIDITEIEGFDNLHQAEGILRDLQKQAARVYGAEESFYLVGGSTAGILSGVSAVLPRGGCLIMGRNCHKAVYHSVYINCLRAVYLFPEVHTAADICKAVSPGQVEKALRENPHAGAVLIVSPTYEGVVSDIGAIAQIVHEKGIPLIVDEAHGAHLGFHPAWPRNACRQGADIVIQSLHKTLPSMTQTALLHVNGRLVDRQRLKRFLSIYQTSSPSYVFMAGMEEAVTYMERHGRTAMESFLQKWKAMLERLKACEMLRVFPEHGQGEGQDIGKLVISAKGTQISGPELYKRLLNQYHLQMEMAAGTYVLAMFTVADTQEAYDRLTRAVLEIDGSLRAKAGGSLQARSGCGSHLETDGNPYGVTVFDPDAQPDKGTKEKLELWEAWDRETEVIELENSEGYLAGDFIVLYPPGIPIVVPGEVLGRETIRRIDRYGKDDLPMQGVRFCEGRAYITVLKR